MPHGNQCIDKLYGGVGRLGTQQAHAQANGRQPILLGGLEAGINRIQHRPQSAMPGMPMRWIEDDICVTRAVVCESLAQPVAQFNQSLRGGRQTTGQIKKTQKIRQA